MKINTSFDFYIDVEEFGITNDIINKIIYKNSFNNENNENINRVKIGLVIGKVREKIDFIFEENGKDNITLDSVIGILSEPLIINQEFNKFSDFSNHILKQYDFSDIKEDFLSNETRVGNFIENSNKIIKNK